MDVNDISKLLADEASYLLDFDRPRIPSEMLYLPGPGWTERVTGESDRSREVSKSLRTLFEHGRLAGTGYLSILPVDQGVEHSAGASFAPNPAYFDPDRILKLAVEGGCSAVASTVGVIGAVSRKYVHRIPYIVKLNHNELLSNPNRYDQVMYAGVRQAYDMGAVAVGATVYFGSPESPRQIGEVSQAFAEGHALGMACVLWCYVRNPAFTVDGVNHETSADLTGQANHLGATIEADIIKQKLPVTNGGYPALNGGVRYGKYDERMYSELSSDHPIDLARYQVLNCFCGRAGLVTSGGGSGGNDLAEAVRTAVINKRAGGMGMISGRKAFQRPHEDGVALLKAIQDVYLCDDVTVA
ncbi:MAG: class I fructose-bisphosphate aldolase [Actinobacteria bacterium]|nr:class I fructose-bisphosphate aldolase [Actinomycetota bacterium]MBU1942724.1 class I fructose-bisphosphate aldolase [Actinomycetota bacterium]MBU2686046.1 class I fructose-bisphosphate aldolase [Actinomycetota bacterium]